MTKKKGKDFTRTQSALFFFGFSVIPNLAIAALLFLLGGGQGSFWGLALLIYILFGGWGASGAIIILCTKLDELDALKFGAIIYYATLISCAGLNKLGVTKDIGAAVGLVISMMACYIHWQKGEIANLYGKVYAKDREIESYKRKFGSLYGEGE